MGKPPISPLLSLPPPTLNGAPALADVCGGVLPATDASEICGSTRIDPDQRVYVGLSPKWCVDKKMGSEIKAFLGGGTV